MTSIRRVQIFDSEPHRYMFDLINGSLQGESDNEGQMRSKDDFLILISCLSFCRFHSREIRKYLCVMCWVFHAFLLEWSTSSCKINVLLVIDWKNRYWDLKMASQSYWVRCKCLSLLWSLHWHWFILFHCWLFAGFVTIVVISTPWIFVYCFGSIFTSYRK